MLGLATAATATYGALALAGDLRGRPALLLPALLVAWAAMGLAWRAVRIERSLLRVALVAALLFRLAASLGAPALSDDLYRYLWDGRMQLHGIQPYALAPADPRLAPLRDDAVGRAVNHPEVPSIYPPLAQWSFLALAALGAGPVGVKLGMGLADFGVVLALAALLRRRGLPDERVLLYAWNPLAVLETGGSGHLEPLGIGLLLLAALWLHERRQSVSAAAFAASVHVKLLPLVLLPALARRLRGRAWLVLGAALVLPVVPFALTGPAVGGGLFVYAERWEHNAPIYSLVDSGLGRAAAHWAVALAAAGWAMLCAWRGPQALERRTLWILGGVLLLSPTLHPWYLLWVLPWAAACGSPGWLLLCATVLVTYAGPAGDVPSWLQAVEFGPALALALWAARTRRASISA